MNKFSITNKKSIYIMILGFVILGGFVFGNIIQNCAQRSFIVNNSRSSLFLLRSTYVFFTIYNKINSKDSLTRLSGYYALLDHKMVDQDFFIERYLREKELPIKRTIIWLLTFANNQAKVKDFYVKTYQNAPLVIKQEILRGLKKIDPGFYKEFIKKNKAFP